MRLLLGFLAGLLASLIAFFVYMNRVFRGW
jgi:hypothetical protein